MQPPIFAAVADDDTGASDLAGMLAEQDLRVLLVIDLPSFAQLAEWAADCDALVLAEGTRNLDPREAYARTCQALTLVAPFEPRVYQIKYCSTFDSTEKGNIGQTIDAALDTLGERFTIALPALPVNGRTTYQGYHFVYDKLLSDSHMRDHPLTPMRNPNLVDLLGKQTCRRVGLIDYSAVDRGEEGIRERIIRLREQGIAIAIVDCLKEEHVENIARAVADLRLITGSSALATKLPTLWKQQGWVPDQPGRGDVEVPSPGGLGCLIVAGSCSVATLEQNDWILSRGIPGWHLDPRKIALGDINIEEIVERAGRVLRSGEPFLLTSSQPPEEVRSAQEWAQKSGLTTTELGRRIERTLASIARRLAERGWLGGLIGAGGETSGALCRALELGALRVGKNIEPGVPLCYSLGRWRMPVVLKSGNFGSRDFYGRALAAMGFSHRP